jgi:hypothetical protein
LHALPQHLIICADLAVVGVGRSGSSVARLSLEAPAFRRVHCRAPMSCVQLMTTAATSTNTIVHNCWHIA